MKGNKMSAILAILLMLSGAITIIPIAYSQLGDIPVGAMSPNISPYATPPASNLHLTWGGDGSPGSTFTVEVWAYDINTQDSMMGYQIGFFFNKDVLQVLSVTNGSALNPYVEGVDYTYIAGQIFNNNGSVSVYTWAIYSTATPPSISGNNTWFDLMHVTFQVNPALTYTQALAISGIPQLMMGFSTVPSTRYQTYFIDQGSYDITPYGHITNGTVTLTVPFFSPNVPSYPTPPVPNLHYEWSTNGTPGSTFTVRIWTTNLSAPLMGWSIGFFFNKDILQVQSVTNGSALNPYTSGLDYTYIPGHIFNTNGSVTVYTWSLFSTAVPPTIDTTSGWIDLMHVTFQINPALTYGQVHAVAGVPQLMMGFIFTIGSRYATLLIDSGSNDITPYGHVVNGTITYTLPPPPPPGAPTAKFTISPNPVTVGTMQTFDASSSLPGSNGTMTEPITDYAWDFGDGSLIFHIATPITTYTYAAAGSWTVTLIVTATGENYNMSSEPVSHTAIVRAAAVGCAIDLYTQNWRYVDPYFINTTYTGSFTTLYPGLADLFRPGDLVQLFAYTTYNGAPVANALVTFEVFDNQNNTVLVATAISNNTGVAEWEFRIPWPAGTSTQVNNFTQGSFGPSPNEELFGLWSAVATWQLGSQYSEQPPFELTQSASISWLVGWGLKFTAISVSPDPAHRGITSVVIKVSVENDYFESVSALLTATIFDNLLVPIYPPAAVSQSWPVGITADYALPAVSIPTYAFVGTAYAVANLLSTWPSAMGTAFCPPSIAEFEIQWP